MDDIRLLLSDKNILATKKLQQIISIIGDGKLRNENNGFRQFLTNISNDQLTKYADECIDNAFPDSGLALQDIVNEIGSRLGFIVTSGLYRGNRNDIGFDGIWKQEENWSIIVEVKTTDAYRVPLDVIARYRSRLIDNNTIIENQSSILIVVGRNDTGELEAQIRGSRHAWDIRIISISSLISLLRIKESLSDVSTAQKISIALRPYEFTRVDKLIDLLFLAIKDVEVEEKADEYIDIDDTSDGEQDGPKNEKRARVNFQIPVYEKIQKYLNTNLIKQTKSSYKSNDDKIGVVISISKQHPASNSQFDCRYWFAFHPHQNSFLEKFENGFACYGCGSENSIIAIPYSFLKAKLNNMWKTENADRDYKHIVIFKNEKGFYLRTNIDGKENYDLLNEFLINEIQQR